MQETHKQENNFQLCDNKNNMGKKVLSITFQLFLWFFIIFSISNHGTFPILVIIYFLYLIIEFTSNTSFFLLNKNSTNSIYNKLKEIFSTAPVVKISCQCFHIERHLDERRDEKGKIITEYVDRKIVTYNGSEYFAYYSFRDVSGLFKIDLNSEIFKNKTYIKLNLDKIISFADAISYSDYQSFKNNFIYQNSHRDKKMDFHEEFTIPNLSKTNLIKIRDNEPFYVNFLFFFLSVILTMGVPYEMLLDQISIEGKYQIKKMISTRYNLNSAEYDNIYGMSIPAIKLGINEFNFIPEEYGHIEQNMEINLPTLEEIENAKIYQNKVNYPIFDEGSDPAPTDLPTEEEIYKYKKNKKNE